MNKSQLIAAIAENSGISATQAEQVLMATLDGITATLVDGNNVSLVGFGNFGVKKRAARKLKNPQTGVEMMVAATVVPFFKAGKNLKELVDTDSDK